MRKGDFFRRWKTPLILVLAFVLSVSVCRIERSVFASGGYTYTIRIFAGNQGKISGGDVKVYSDLSYGDRVAFQMRDVTLSDASKYYVRGIRESGKDNNTVSNLATITVTGDLDYVVAYGILGSSVAYTVNYVDASGRELAPSETYYGNVGERPVIAFLYIEGYFPNAYNLTKTLTENAADNVLTFVYSPIEPETTAAPTTTEAPRTTTAASPTRSASNPTNPAPAPTNPQTPTSAAGPTNPAAPTTTVAPTSAGQPVTPQNPTQPSLPEQPAQPEQPVAQEGQEQPTQPTSAAQPTTAAQPATQALPVSPDDVQELIDLDNPQVPLANFPGAESSSAEESSTEESTIETTKAETAPVVESPEELETRAPKEGFLGMLTDGAGHPKPVVIGVIGAVLLLLIGLFLRRRF